jgi:hypothetical protein
MVESAYGLSTGEAIRQRNVSDIARKTGLGRTSIYRSFRGQQFPNLTTVLPILNAMDFQLKVTRRPRKGTPLNCLALRGLSILPNVHECTLSELRFLISSARTTTPTIRSLKSIGSQCAVLHLSATPSQPRSLYYLNNMKSQRGAALALTCAAAGFAGRISQLRCWSPT